MANTHIILYQPRIPQNTGNIGRLCALTRSCLHLIHPLGFQISDREIRRSGMDYWYSLDLHEYEDWQSFLTSPNRPQRIWLFTTKAKKTFWEASFQAEDGLLFGNETNGCPEAIHQWIGQERRITIPHYNSSLRSHNLSNSVGIGLYETLRQTTPH